LSISNSRFLKATRRFQIGFLLAVLFSVLLVGSLVIERYAMQSALVALNERRATAERLIGQVIHLDEVLTMSARMAAATGNPDWVKRYDAELPKITNALEALNALASAEIAKKLQDDTVFANDELVKIETAVFDKVKAGDLAAAQALFDQTYDRYKATLAEGSDAFNASLIASIEHETLSIERRFYWLLLGCGLFGFVSLVAWIHLFQNMRHAVKHVETTEISRAAAEEERLLEMKRQADEQNAKLERAAVRDIRINGFAELAEDAFAKSLAHAERVQSASTEMAALASKASDISMDVAAGSTSTRDLILSSSSMFDELNAEFDALVAMATGSTDKSRMSVEQASQANTAMKELSEKVGVISAVVGMIAGIADQTNLLALNATIEAARAGEAGRGFAVVASEVKSLAQQTSTSTEQIRSIVRDIEVSIGDVAKTIEESLSSIELLSATATEVERSVNRQRQASADILADVKNASETAAFVASEVARAGEANQQSTASASALKHSADTLAQASASFQRELADFLTDVRAA
jgi:methyl-accepting chemotaxis protein